MKKEILFHNYEINMRIRELGKEISKDYEKKNPHFLGILKGALFFSADLLRNVDITYDIDFLKIESYGSGKESSGNIRIHDYNRSIEGKDVIVLEDIVDSGLTLDVFLSVLKERNPKSVEVCVLLNNTYRRKKKVDVKYNGFWIKEKRFLVGYGLDYAENGRNLPDLYRIWIK